MNLSVLYKKLFISGDWEIAFRYNKSGDFYASNFTKIPNTRDYWFADPLIFEIGDKTFLFCEAFNRKLLKGELGYFEIRGTHVSDFKLVLSPNYHMSFPNVFHLNGRYYMIPESGENKCLELYEAKKFPNEWVKVRNLIEGVNYVDPTLLFLNDEVLCFVYIDKKGEYETRIYKIDYKELELQYVSSIFYQENCGRSAGQFFRGKDGRLFRPVQLGEGEYGKRTAFYEIKIKDDEVKETLVGIIDNDKIHVNGKNGVDKIHTYSKVGSYEAIDYVNYKFDMFKRFKILLRKYKLRKRHI